MKALLFFAPVAVLFLVFTVVVYKPLYDIVDILADRLIELLSEAE